MKYLCPKCDQEMTSGLKGKMNRCKPCNIHYFVMIKSNHISHINMFNNIDNSKSFLLFPTSENSEQKTQIYGSFDYCCRAYKMKAFL